MTDLNQGTRPLSPHLQVYRLYTTMIVSGLHRITGVGMLISAILVLWWFIAGAVSPQYFNFVDGVLNSWIGLLVMVVSLYGLCHHLLNGIRHLIWDTGSLMGKKTADRGAWYVLIGAPVLTVVIIIIVMLG